MDFQYVAYSRIRSSVLIRKYTGQGKPVFYHILRWTDGNNNDDEVTNNNKKDDNNKCNSTLLAILNIMLMLRKGDDFN